MSKRYEQLLFRYSNALERGDFEAVAEVLHDAERDPALEQMILDMNAAYTAEQSVNSNHKNSKEIPMIAALYQKRTPAYVRWQSLPLVAALAVIGLLVVMLAVQTRGTNFSNIGDNGKNGIPLAVAQNSARCQATTLTDATLLSLPGPGGIDLYSLPAGTSVYVRASYGSPVWYLINSQASQGWVTSDTLDMSHCAESQILPGLPTATPGVSGQASPTPDQFDLTWTCGARVQTEIDLAAFPSLYTVYIGSLPAQTAVTVLDYNIMVGSQGIQTPWYLIKSGSIQGWTPAYLLDAPNCPPIPDLNIGVVVQAQTATAQAALLATATQMIRNVTRTAEPPTFTPTPAPYSEASALPPTALPPTIIPPENDTTGIAQHPFYIYPTLDPLVLTAIVATLNATYQPMATMIPAQNSSQDATVCSTPAAGDPQHLTVYAQPVTDAAIVTDFYTVDGAKSQLSVLQATYLAGQTWYYIEIGSYPNQPRGWVSKERFDAVMGSCNITYVQPIAAASFTPMPAVVNADQQASVPAVKCPTPSNVLSILMYSRPSLDSFKFSQAYDATRYAFILLDSTEVDGQTWYFVRIGSTVDEKQGWITWDDYNILKDCSPFNTSAQANSVPSDSTIPLVPTITPAAVQALPTFTPAPADVQAAATIPRNGGIYATDKFPIYTVQSGDTVLYILSQFGLDAQALPRVQELNFLNRDGDLTPGMALVIPVSLPDAVTTCTILSGQTIDLRAQPLKSDPVVYFLPQPTTLIVEGEFKNGDGMWAAVTAQVGSITMAGVWIQVDQMDAAATCSQGVGAATISIPTSLSATPTLVR